MGKAHIVIAPQREFLMSYIMKEHKHRYSILALLSQLIPPSISPTVPVLSTITQPSYNATIKSGVSTISYPTPPQHLHRHLGMPIYSFNDGVLVQYNYYPTQFQATHAVPYHKTDNPSHYHISHIYASTRS